MKIDWKHLIAPAIALVLIALAVSAYVQEREDRLRAELTRDLTQKSIDARDKASAEQIKQLQDLAAKVTRPEQVAQALPQVIELKTPIVQVSSTSAKSEGNSPKSEGNLSQAGQTQRSLPQGKGDSALPEAASAAVVAQPGDLIIRKEATVEFYQHEATCKQNAIALETCTADLKDVKVQRDAATTAVKGGSFFTRLKRNAKWFAIGGAAGAAGVLATRR